MGEQTAIIYGISNCDTIKKARKWLTDHSVSYDFHDYKKKGIDKDKLSSWCEHFGWETLINRRGTTWRKLDESQKSDLNQAKAIQLMIDNTSLIKRPVLEQGNQRLLGFKETEYQTIFNG